MSEWEQARANGYREVARMFARMVDQVREEEDRAYALRHVTVESLGVSVAATNCLRRGGIRTVKDLLSRSRREVAALPGIGVTAMREIEAWMGKERLGFACGCCGQPDNKKEGSDGA